MKLNDAVWGALLMLFGAAIVLHVQSFPTIPGQKVGPALFPGLIAAGLAVCGAALIATGVKAHRGGGERVHWFELDGWTGSRRHVIAFALVVGVNVFYVALVDRLGFIVTGTLYLAVLFAVFGVRRRSIVPLALVLTLVIHFSFYKLLRVPLPWGFLQGIAW